MGQTAKKREDEGVKVKKEGIHASGSIDNLRTTEEYEMFRPEEWANRVRATRPAKPKRKK